MAERVGSKFAKGLNSGFDALHLSLKALDIGPGDEVVTVAHTFMATISAIALVGAKPVLIDVGDDWNMDMSQLEDAITPKTKAIIPVHLNGRMCDMDILGQIIEKFEDKGQKIHVIEDAAQALGAKMQMANGEWRSAGEIGTTGCFSHYPAKIFGAFGEGGTLTTSDAEIDEKVLLLRYHGVLRDPARTPKMFGYNAVLDNLQAAILNVKLSHYDDWLNRRQAIAKKYQAGLGEIQGLKLPHFEDKRYSDVYQNYVIRIKYREELVQFLEKSGVETIISWRIPNHLHPALKLTHFKLPKTEKLSNEVVSLPMYPELTNEQVHYVIDVIHDFYEGK